MLLFNISTEDKSFIKKTQRPVFDTFFVYQFATTTVSYLVVIKIKNVQKHCMPSTTAQYKRQSTNNISLKKYT